MKISILKPKGKKETVTRVELMRVVKEMVQGEYLTEVHRLRELYPLVHPTKTEDGQLSSSFNLKLTLPRLCFAMEMQQLKEEAERRKMTIGEVLTDHREQREAQIDDADFEE